VIIWSNDNFVVYDVSMILDPSSATKIPDENGLLVTPTKPMPIDIDDFIQSRTRPQPVDITNIFVQ